MLNSEKGLVLLTGCGHAGIVNIATYVEKRFNDEQIDGIVGGLHLYASTDQQVDWTASQLRKYHVPNLLAAYCTGVEATRRLRDELGLSRKTEVMASVGSSFSSGEGIQAGSLAQ